MSLCYVAFLRQVPAIYGIDTRALTKRICKSGVMLGKIIAEGTDEQSVKLVDQNDVNLVAQVSIKTPQLYATPNKPHLNVAGHRIRILAIDCGIKTNIIRYFMAHGVDLLLVPWDYDFSDEKYDGLFISNGPGNPITCTATIAQLKIALTKPTPIFGICLGNQLLALAAGCKTYKMKFGNRGANQPCIDTRTNRCYITAQNHGFAVDSTTLPHGWSEFFVNANDNTNEGIIHQEKPHFSVQFHPEGCAGPTDTDFLFKMFLDRVSGSSHPITISHAPRLILPRRVLLLGSGGLSIGQAGEFDYSGSQAIKALKEVKCYVILINPNIATVQTSQGMADRVYFQPVTLEVVKEVIVAERPDSILLQFGGQTALNCGVELYKSGLLDQYNVNVLGTPVEAILATEDRELFSDKLREIDEKIGAPSSSKALACPSGIADCTRLLPVPPFPHSYGVRRGHSGRSRRCRCEDRLPSHPPGCIRSGWPWIGLCP